MTSLTKRSPSLVENQLDIVGNLRGAELRTITRRHLQHDANVLVLLRILGEPIIIGSSVPA